MPSLELTHARRAVERAYRFSALSALLVTAALSTGCRQCGSDSTAAEATRTTSEPTAAPLALEPPTPERAAVAATAPAGSRANDRSPLGTNLAGVNDWSTEIPFIDVFRMSRELTSGSAQAWADGRKLDLDPRGWLKSLAPGQEARSIMLNGSRFRDGRYTVLYEGRGEYRYSGTARLDSEASRPGRDVLDLDRTRGETGITFDVSSVDPSNPLRNIRVLPPGGACSDDRARFCDAKSPCPTGACLEFAEHYEELVFHPDFLSRIQRYGMLRFMDWQHTNNSEHVRPEQLGDVRAQTWVHGGYVPIEVMAKLANQLHAEPWFCVPHQANDDYARKMAEILKARLDPSLPVWIEYSNEVWNGMFQQHHYMQERAVAAGHPNNFQGALRFYAQRSLEIFKIFEAVLGKDRVKAVLGSQAANTWISGEVLGFPGMAGHVDALAIAPYFGLNVGPDDLPRIRKMTVDEAFKETMSTLIPTTKQWLVDQGAVAKAHNVQLVAYEAGQHYVGYGGAEEDPVVNKLFDQINRDPRMKDAYLAYLENWKSSGGTWLNHYVNCDVFSKWGRWGALENVQQPREQAPKYDALMTFIEKTPRWW